MPLCRRVAHTKVVEPVSVHGLPDFVHAERRARIFLKRGHVPLKLSVGVEAALKAEIITGLNDVRHFRYRRSFRSRALRGRCRRSGLCRRCLRRRALAFFLFRLRRLPRCGSRTALYHLALCRSIRLTLARAAGRRAEYPQRTKQ